MTAKRPTPAQARALANRHYCQNSRNIGGRHTAGTGKPRRKKCEGCGSAIVTVTGLYGVFVWRGDGRYPLADAVKTYTTEARADAFSLTDTRYVVRWVGVDAPAPAEEVAPAAAPPAWPLDAPREETPAPRPVVPAVGGTLATLAEVVLHSEESGPDWIEHDGQGWSQRSGLDGSEVRRFSDATVSEAIGRGMARASGSRLRKPLPRVCNAPAPAAPGDMVEVTGRPGELWAVAAVATNTATGEPYLRLTRPALYGVSGTAVPPNLVSVVKRAAEPIGPGDFVMITATRDGLPWEVESVGERGVTLIRRDNVAERGRDRRAAATLDALARVGCPIVA